MNKIIQALCGMLVHSVWQSLLFTVIAGCVVMLTRRSSGLFRYIIITFLFLLLAGVFVATFIWQWNIAAVDVSSPTTTILFSGPLFQINGLHDLWSFGEQFVSANSSLIVMIWLIIFGFKCCRTAGAVVYNLRVSSQKVQPASLYWTEKIQLLAKQLQIKKAVLLLESEIIKVPVVIGHIKPVVLIPLGLLTHLPPAQIEAVLLHELAHIRRSDYLMNLFQHIIETVFFFNPGLLWISSLMREERENCCDDITLKQTNNKKLFIQALVNFKELALYRDSCAPAFPGKRNQLLHRVTRIIHNRNKNLDLPERIFFVCSFICLCLIAASAATTGTPLTSSQEQNKSLIPFPQQITKTSSVFTAPVSIKSGGSIASGEKTKAHESVKTYYYKNMIKENKREVEEYLMKKEEEEFTTVSSTQQAEEQRKQSLEDREQAAVDRVQALMDREQAEMDKEQAFRDREQAAIERAQSLADRIQAEADEQHGLKNP